MCVGEMSMKGTERVRESLVFSSGYVVCVVCCPDLSNYPALSRAPSSQTQEPEPELGW